MAFVLKAYNSALQRRPMLAQCATSAVLFGASDVVAQQAVEKRGWAKHDFSRTARSTFYGGLLFGPLVTKWFQFLNRLQFKTPARGVFWRVYMDQFMFTPGVVAFYFGSMTLLEGKGVTEAKSRIEAAYVPTIIRNWGVFIPTQLINFALVPHHMRVLTVCVVSLFWNTYLSIANSQATTTQQEQKQEKAVEASHDLAAKAGGVLADAE